MSSPKTINQQIQELDELLEWFEQPDLDIEQALKKFDQGVDLAEAIKKRLAEAENKIKVLKQRFDTPQ